VGVAVTEGVAVAVPVDLARTPGEEELAGVTVGVGFAVGVGDRVGVGVYVGVGLVDGDVVCSVVGEAGAGGAKRAQVARASRKIATRTQVEVWIRRSRRTSPS
jgi:hypothetical protein